MEYGKQSSTEAEDLITYIIPFRAKSSCSDWGKVAEACRGTLQSLVEQDSSAFNCVLICHDVPEPLPTGLKRLQIIKADFEEPKDRTEYKRDKGLKIRAGLDYLKRNPSRYFMVVDADDRISRHLTSYVIDYPTHTDMLVNRGYVYPGGFLVRSHDGNFDRLCGSVFISTIEELYDENIYILEGHQNIKERFSAAKKELHLVPFPAVIKNVGYGENITKTEFLWSRSIKRTIKKLFMMRFLTKRVEKEFALDKVPV